MDSNDVLRRMLRANLHQRQYAELVGVGMTRIASRVCVALTDWQLCNSGNGPMWRLDLPPCAMLRVLLRFLGGIRVGCMQIDR